MSSILAIARKDLILLTRNRGALFFTFAWPLIVALFFGLMFGGPSKRPRLDLGDGGRRGPRHERRPPGRAPARQQGPEIESAIARRRWMRS